MGNNLGVFKRSLSSICHPILDDALRDIPPAHKYTKNSMQSRKINKKYKSMHYAHNVFFKEPFSQSPSPLLKNGHLFFVHFRRAMPFLFWTFIESDRIGYLKVPTLVGFVYRHISYFWVICIFVGYRAPGKWDNPRFYIHLRIQSVQTSYSVDIHCIFQEGV